MLQMQERVEGKNTIKVCRNGNITEHMLSMDWQERFETGVREVREPHYEQQAFDFEVFCGSDRDADVNQSHRIADGPDSFL
jgi:hypothetical protein